MSFKRRSPFPHTGLSYKHLLQLPNDDSDNRPTLDVLCTLTAMMDDVWGNAWSQPEEDVAHSVPAKPRLNNAWTFPSAAADKDEEADVGIPSWNTGGLGWSEPTGHESMWSSAPAVGDTALDAVVWGTSSDLKPDFASVGEQVESDNLPTQVLPIENGHGDVPEPEEEQSRSSTPDSVGTVTSPTVNVELSSPIAEPASTPTPVAPTVIEAPESPDPFGSFEEGLTSVSTTLDEGGTTWVSPVATFDDVDAEEGAWGSAWGTPYPEDTSNDSPKDEWAIAREEKTRRDRSVPPERLAAIVDRLNDLSADLWPEKDKPKFEQELGNWRDGMGNVDGFDELIRKALPETSTQPPIQFSGSHTAKAMAKSLKLSRNLPIVRNSPMSHLFTAKSLAAWELSVKSKVKVPRDDIPVGWKTVETEEKHDAKPALMGKKSSGILSFFNRGASATSSPAPAPNGTDSKRSSLSREAPSDAGSGSFAMRNSSDTNSLSSKMQQSSSVSSLYSVPPATPPSPSAAPSSAVPPSSSSSTASSSHPQESPLDSSASPAPSVVSRFFNRFSRTRSDMRSSSSSPGSSIALSTNDLEFLSDIVPSHSDDADEDEQLNSLTALVSSPALPAKLPPPLAPPPLAPPPRPSSISRSHTPPPPPQPLLPSMFPPTTLNMSNPLSDLGSLGVQSLVSRRSANMPMSNEIIAPALPPALPPPLSSRSAASLSKPPTPSPLSGGVVRAGSPRMSTPPRAWSPAAPASTSPPPASLSPHPTDFKLGHTSPFSVGMDRAGSSSSRTPLSNAPLQINLQSDLQSGFSPTSSTPPPPIEKSPNRIFKRPKEFFEDDDFFSDFQDHETPCMPMMQTSQLQAASSFDTSFDIFSDQSMLQQHNASQDDSFGDFGDFMSTSTSTAPALPMCEPPTPLSPPIGPIGVPPPLPKKKSEVNVDTKHIRKTSAADHDAAARLVERAAARQGRWPAPPSPLPEPLSPPPSGGVNTRAPMHSQLLLELDNNPGIRQPLGAPLRSIALKPIAQITSSAASQLRVASPPILPPPNLNPSSNSVLQASLLDFGDTHAPPLPLSHTPPASSAGSTKGGLSAQELSFFEGL